MRNNIYFSVHVSACILLGDAGSNDLPDRKVFLSGKARMKQCVFFIFAIRLLFAMDAIRSFYFVP